MEGKSEETESKHEDEDGEGEGSQRTNLQKRRQTHSFYCTTDTVKRLESKEDTTLTMCQVVYARPCNTDK